MDALSENRDPGHILLLPFGTSGSVFPFIWLGRLLLRRGHRVTMITAGIHEKAAASAGLNFIPLGSDVVERMLNEADLWREVHGSKVAYQHAGEATRYYVEAIEVLIAREGVPDLMLAPMICFGARLMREKRGIPLISVHLYPMMFVSAHAPPLVARVFRWLRRLPLWLRKIVLAMPNPLDFMALRGVWACCDEHAVTRPMSLWRQWWHSPDGVLALFPAWFAAPQPDWPGNLLQWDFPMEDMVDEKPLEQELMNFLQEGPQPVMFTAGSGQFHAEKFFATALELTQQLGCRAVFISAKAGQVPKELPPSVYVTAYAPFSTLLPHARAFVHHGGIGTMSQSLAAGIPQLVVDMALDQHDNAERLEQLGVGLSIPASRFSTERARPLLQRCISDPTMRARAVEHAARMKTKRDPAVMLQWLEEKCRNQHPQA
ncbi:glycosyltransferase [Prosthecobacter vanneervenii]|uniref:Rhamnosyltransferase subunit B n=1 Tax=Prosthecobacter vanneervenii TaxID=48466 RepID=A0A7W8DM67_9BACT|nr:nucleotide disphospho-sugar-binding domain-containing protein [Prosthecobacter vanneervenii]MBB5034760.1 rhamnosyltransferase subunit B [Prosthecobacter vanneervenii]